MEDISDSNNTTPYFKVLHVWNVQECVLSLARILNWLIIDYLQYPRTSINDNNETYLSSYPWWHSLSLKWPRQTNKACQHRKCIAVHTLISSPHSSDVGETGTSHQGIVVVLLSVFHVVAHQMLIIFFIMCSLIMRQGYNTCMLIVLYLFVRFPKHFISICSGDYIIMLIFMWWYTINKNMGKIYFFVFMVKRQ